MSQHSNYTEAHALLQGRLPLAFVSKARDAYNLIGAARLPRPQKRTKERP